LLSATLRTTASTFSSAPLEPKMRSKS